MKKAGIVYQMLTGLYASVAPLKAGNMEVNEVPQDASPLVEDLKHTAAQAGSLKTSFLNLKALIHSGRILPGPEILRENKCSELQV